MFDAVAIWLLDSPSWLQVIWALGSLFALFIGTFVCFFGPLGWLLCGVLTFPIFMSVYTALFHIVGTNDDLLAANSSLLGVIPYVFWGVSWFGSVLYACSMPRQS